MPIRHRAAAVLTTLALVLAGLTAAGVAVAASTTRAGTTITRSAFLTQDTAATYTGTGYTTVAALRIIAGAGQFIDVTYTAESACYGPTAGGWCSIRILVDGAEAAPVVGTDFAFNEVESATSWESHSVERVRTATFTGTHTVAVQTAQVGGGTTHRLDDWLLRAFAVAV